MRNLVSHIEDYLKDYVVFSEPYYALPLALWCIGTYCFREFDAYPYVIITSPTKRSGKTRLMEMLSFVCHNPRRMSSVTGPTFFRLIEQEAPVIFYDEAEKLNSEAATTEREVINVGYRRGSTIPRTFGQTVKDYDTYSPKVFVLIGSTYDTLTDRSLVVTMHRGEPAKRFTFLAVRDEGAALKKLIEGDVKRHTAMIQKKFAEHAGLPFLLDRDEEIWTSLFVIADVFCPDRLIELERCASDMCAEKTLDKVTYSQKELKLAETEAKETEYGKRCLIDLWGIFATNGAKYLRTEDAVQSLRDIPTSPWRKYGGKGISDRDLAKLLDRFRVQPCRIALGHGRGNQKHYRGYKRSEVESAVNKL